MRVYSGISEGARDVAYVMTVSTDPSVYIGVNGTRAEAGDAILILFGAISLSRLVLDLGLWKMTAGILGRPFC